MNAFNSFWVSPDGEGTNSLSNWVDFSRCPIFRKIIEEGKSGFSYLFFDSASAKGQSASLEKIASVVESLIGLGRN